MSVLAETIREAVPDFSGVVRVDAGGDSDTLAFGLAHRGFQIPNHPDTQFAIASGNKPMTALVVVSLIDEGLLSLDTTARSLLGADLPLISQDVTIEHLLAHRSGIGDYIDEDDPEYDDGAYVLHTPVHALDTTEAFLAELDGHPPKFAAGTGFAYCNAGYVVLALLAERASGIGYHDLVKQRVLEPAGLRDTAFLRTDEPSGRMALGYLDTEGLRTNMLHLPVRGNGDGGLYTTAADVSAFWVALFDGRIVSEERVREMTRPRSVDEDEGLRCGLGFYLEADGDGVLLIGQDAGVSFFSSYDPTRGDTLTVLANTSEGAWPVVGALR